MNVIELHKLTIEQGTYGPRWAGYCGCSDPDWTGDGWDGQVDFYGETKDEIREQHFEHVLEVHK